MVKPIFKIYWEWNPEIEAKIKWNLSIKHWDGLEERHKKNIILYLEKKKWIDEYSDILVNIWNYFNEKLMSVYPFRSLNKIIPEKDYSSAYRYKNDYEMKKAAYNDFKEVLLNAKEEIVYMVISKFAEKQIDFSIYSRLTIDSTDEDIYKAFEKFDRFCNCFNHISEQYWLDVILTRDWLIPKQDEIIINNVYIPTISLLQNPKWDEVDKLLLKVFEDFQNKKYSLVISWSHNTLQKFLQVFLWEKEENWKWAFWKYFSEFKKNEKLNNQYTSWIIAFTQSFLSSERAGKSEAKPTKNIPTFKDALLVMNSVMIFINFCLLNEWFKK